MSERKKVDRLVITFPNTTSALSMEAAAGQELGRLIPIPRDISSGCGLAWCSKPELEGKLTKLMGEQKISFSEARIIPLYV